MSRRRSPSPGHRRQSPTPDRNRSRERRRGDVRERENGRRDRDYGDDRRGRDEYATDNDREGRSERRRASPQYDDYRRPAPPPEDQSQAPWRQPENMSSHRNGNRPPYAGGPSGGGDFMESRRLQRESQVVDIWPPSPKAPARDLSPKRSKSSKKSKRARSPSTDSSSSSEEERRRRERKERKRSRRERGHERDSERRRHRSRSRSRSRRKSYDDDSEDDRRRRRNRERDRRMRHRSRSRQRTKSPEHSIRSPPRHPAENEDEWVVKEPMAPPTVPVRSETKETAAAVPGQPVYDDDDSADELGPQPLPKPSASRRVDERSYGGALLRGEGSAMAAFLKEGTEARIPRRGEIGLTSGEIAKYEGVGYVMSGSRHRRMNAVRMRKENQVISAEEKRGILKLQKEERERRESILREEFSELVEERLKGATLHEPKAT
ncbi:hypothetical protein C0995_009892 [Termitomyces sp. Mi166|nr:hypothetical protein C0995_009892 [Termitomyces sp. Mi166\